MSGGRRGSVRQEPNGTWTLAADIGVAGERKQTRRRGFATRKSAQAELTRILTRSSSGPTSPEAADPRRVPDRDVAAGDRAHRQSRRRPQLPPQYPAARRRSADRAPPAAGPHPADLNALYGQLLGGDDQRRKLSPRTTRYVATILHRALRDAVRWQAIVRNPAEAADPPRPSSSPEMRTWSGAELGGSSRTSPPTGWPAGGDCWPRPGCAAARCSGCAGPTSTSTPGRCGSPGR